MRLARLLEMFNSLPVSYLPVFRSPTPRQQYYVLLRRAPRRLQLRPSTSWYKGEVKGEYQSELNIFAAYIAVQVDCRSARCRLSANHDPMSRFRLPRN